MISFFLFFSDMHKNNHYKIVRLNKQKNLNIFKFFILDGAASIWMTFITIICKINGVLFSSALSNANLVEREKTFFLIRL